MKKEQDSPAIALLRHVWTEQGKAFGGHSWERLNAAMRDALRLAICCGMKFDKEDFAVIDKEFRFSYWGGTNDSDKLYGERFYALACKGRRGVNRSAAIAFEEWAGRRPFIYKGVNRYYVKAETPRRLAIGSEIEWYEGRETIRTRMPLRLCVTSFANDGSALVACEREYDEDHRAKVTRRVTITLDDLREHNRWLAEQLKAIQKERITEKGRNAA